MIIKTMLAKIILIFALLTTAYSPSLGNAEPNASELKSKSLFGKLKLQNKDITIKWNSTLGTPSLIEGNLTSPSRHSSLWIVYGFMQKMRTYYGLRDPKSNLVLEDMMHNFDGGVTIRFTQLLFNVPVYNASLTFELDKEGVIHTVHGTIYPQLERTLYNLPIYPVVSPNQAAQIATRALAHPSTLTGPVVKPYYLFTQGNTQRIYEVSLGESGRVWVHAVLGHIVPIEKSQQSVS
ncbi:hypothetical protein [Paenibacillus sp. YAF4_2]|uniref:hypothetical protein n=1 Tax=Paenibacillus sp. YAF4_2 TaxID=3233085 RepID=UPI003F988B7B